MVANSNRARIFADVVSVDAWHQAFDGECAIADLHADVVFQEARVGGEANSPVRFRLRLRRAEVVVVIPETETSLRILRDSVARDTDRTETTSRMTLSRRTQVSGTVSAGLTASPDSIGGKLSAEATAAGEQTRTEELESERLIGNMVVTQSKTPDGHYRWTLAPGAGPFLDGRGWDAKTAPRLKIEDR